MTGVETCALPICLGLYIAKTIVGAHGGDIWATSENGVTQFNFTLPTVR